MKTIVEAYDSESGEDVIPMNLPPDYKPMVGQIIETTDGRYEVKAYVENKMGGFVSRITLVVSKAN